MTDRPDLAALIASRICHDLISPIGAIGNGVELLAMDADKSGPELELLSESVAQANARVRFFRIAFGAATAEQEIGQSEVVSVLAELGRGGRLRFGWNSAATLSRQDVRLALLLVSCVEAALAYGGQVEVAETEGRWSIVAEAPRLRIDAGLWAMLEGGPSPRAIAASEVQFCLAVEALASLGRRLVADLGTTRLRLSF